MSRRTIKRRVVCIERGEEPRIRHSELLCKGDEGDPVQNHREGVILGDSLSAQDCDWQLPRLAEEKLRPMLVAIEHEPRPRRPAVSYSPQHCQAAQLVEPITGINERSTARLSFLSEELKALQCPLSPSTLLPALSSPFPLNLHVQSHCQPLRRLLLCCRRLHN